MKLELKHLAGYLPYGLKVRYIERNETHILDFSNLNSICSYQIHLKPILRPLSDLIKEIKLNGEKFVPIIEICKLSETVNELVRINAKSNICGFDFTNEIQEILRFCYHFNTKHFQLTNEESYNQCILNQYEMFQKLLEWHFDIHGLIEKGLAIDINTLDK